MDLDTLCDDLDRLFEQDPGATADRDSIVRLHRQLSRLECYVTRATGEFDTWGEWAMDGAQTTSAWVATACHLPNVSARRRVKLARKLCHLPLARAAWEAGELTAEHVGALAALHAGATAEALVRDEALLVEKAKTLRFESFLQALAYWRQLADPDGTEEQAEKRRCARKVTLNESVNGMWLGEITLDEISGAIVAEELARLEQRFFDADWAQAKERLGHEPRPADLARTPGQRRADALVEMARRSKDSGEGSRRSGPLFTVVIDYQTLIGRICELANGSVVSPGSVVPWLREADLERAVFTPKGRVEIGQKSRLFGGATSRAIELRDRQCTHPFCDKAAPQCEFDHVIPFAQGGPTTQENGQLQCGFHNRLRTQRPPPGG